MQLRKELRQGFHKHSFKNDGSLNKCKKKISNYWRET